ncbi:Glycerol kinase [Suttonella ornithocola]|uniref:Glycerol kinase n=1 Tax=Suttonella ornithocola TaxID=279832 RepID=A0A380MP20_9GAMM|nr:Glycerol kinase [Suttonella ornithocola]
MLPDFWLNEGGQSAAGAAIDRLLNLFSHDKEQEAAEQLGQTLYQYLEERAVRETSGYSQSTVLAEGLHIVPEFAGNRSPIPNPHARAVIAGLGMGETSLVNIYIAGLIGLGYGLRQILEMQESNGVLTKNIVISGGAGQSKLVKQLLADTTGKIIVNPESPEPVLLGAAILGAVASKSYPTAQAAMKAMAHIADSYAPNQDFKSVHEQRYKIFCELQEIAHKVSVI